MTNRTAPVTQAVTAPHLPTPNEVTESMEALRKARNISEERLAELAVMSLPTLRRRLKHDGLINLAEIHRISLAFGVPSNSWGQPVLDSLQVAA